MYKQPPVDRQRLQRAVVFSALVHGLAAIIGYAGFTGRPSGRGSDSLIDVELAPPAPKAEHLPPEIARQYFPAGVVAGKDEDEDRVVEPGSGSGAMPDAAEPPDARPRRRPDSADRIAAMDAAPADGDPDQVAIGGDGGYAGDAVAVAVGVGSGAGDGTGSGSGSADLGAVTGDNPDTAGEPGTASDVSAGVAANLLAYFPKGHVVTAMIRFDRIRGSRWQPPVDKLFKFMPDHITLIPPDKGLGDLFDNVIISSTDPTDPRAGTLVVRHHATRAELRDMLATPETPVAWSVAKGGLYGNRSGGDRVLDNDDREFLFPYAGWLLLVHPHDVPGMLAPSTGDMDTAVASGTIPGWLAGIRKIEDESGTKGGPTLVLTMAPTSKRYDIPDIGLDLTSVPAPERFTVSLEFVKGFIVKGNLKFRSEAEAKEFVESATAAQARVMGSTILKGILKRAKAFNAISGLTLDRRGARVSYATSVSQADADAILAIAGQYLEAYFTEAQQKADQRRGK